MLRLLHRILGLGGLALGGLSPHTAAAAASPRPNFVLILSDDQGWTMTGVPADPAIPESGSAYYETPAMDRLAREGMRFTSGYAPAPLCTPTRRSLLCGMTPARQRGTEFPSEFDPRLHLTLPQALKSVDRAYVCAHFGKWGEQMRATPAEAGYDASDGQTGNKHGGFAGVPKGGPRNRPTVELDDPKLTFSVTGRAVEFLRARGDDRQPFLLQVSYYAVHEDNQVRPATRAKYARKGRLPSQIEPAVAGMLDDMNAGMADLLAALERHGLAANTYVVFSSDNGGNHRLYDGDDATLPLCNHPLRLGKHSLYEGGIRVPFLVRGPGVAPGSVCRTPVAHYDLLPTFYDLAGGRTSLPATIDGGSLRPLLANAGRGDVARGLPGLVFHRPNYSPPLSVLRVGPLKLVVDWQRGAKELYDLDRDLGETRDLAASQPAKTAELFAQLDAYLRAVNAETYDPKSKPPAGKGAP